MKFCLKKQLLGKSRRSITQVQIPIVVWKRMNGGRTRYWRDREIDRQTQLWKWLLSMGTGENQYRHSPSALGSDTGLHFYWFQVYASFRLLFQTKKLRRKWGKSMWQQNEVGILECETSYWLGEWKWWASSSMHSTQVPYKRSLCFFTSPWCISLFSCQLSWSTMHTLTKFFISGSAWKIVKRGSIAFGLTEIRRRWEETWDSFLVRALLRILRNSQQKSDPSMGSFWGHGPHS